MPRIRYFGKLPRPVKLALLIKAVDCVSVSAHDIHPLPGNQDIVNIAQRITGKDFRLRPCQFKSYAILLHCPHKSLSLSKINSRRSQTIKQSDHTVSD